MSNQGLARELERARGLYRLSQMVTASLDLDTTLDAIAGAIHQLTALQAGGTRVDVQVAAAALVPDANHLSDTLHGRWQSSTQECLKFEQRAFANESAYWHAVTSPQGRVAPASTGRCRSTPYLRPAMRPMRCRSSAPIADECANLIPTI
jgi:hypothetical protein